MEEVCKTSWHINCPPLPKLGCALEAMPNGLFTNCQWLEFFGDRYYQGDFDVSEIALFVRKHNYHLAVIRTDMPNNIQYITQPERKGFFRPLTRSIVLYNDNNIHWHSGYVTTLGDGFIKIASFVLTFIKMFKRKELKKSAPEITVDTFMEGFGSHLNLSAAEIIQLQLDDSDEDDVKVPEPEVTSESFTQGFSESMNLTPEQLVQLQLNDDSETEDESSSEQAPQVALQTFTSGLDDSLSLSKDQIIQMQIPEDSDDESVVEPPPQETADQNLEYKPLTRSWADEVAEFEFMNQKSDLIDMQPLETIIEDTDFEQTVDTVQCCKVPHDVTPLNFNLINSLFMQFDSIFPDYHCLINFMNICNAYLDLMHNSTVITIESVNFIKKYTHFRHDVFDFIFKNCVMKVHDCFNNEKPFPLIESNRTPDYLKIDYEKKTVLITEFTVVMNALRANFLKGTTSENSVYRNEIKMYQDLGFSVTYHPIFFSLTDDLQVNANVWASLGYSVDNQTFELLNRYRETVNFEYNYLLSYNFNKIFSRDFPNAQDFVNDNKADEDNWQFLHIKANKRLFYYLCKYLREQKIELEKFYYLRKFKNNEFSLNEIAKPKYNSVTGQHLLEIISDDYSIWKNFSSLVSGNDICYVRTSRKMSINTFKPMHGTTITSTITDNPINIKIARNNNMISMEHSQLIDDKLLKGEMNNISTPNNIDDVRKSVDIYKQEMYNWVDLNNQCKKLEDSPRRSFLAYADTELAVDLDLNCRPSLISMDVNDLKSKVARTLYDMSNKIQYEPVDYEEPKFEEEKEKYRQSCNDYFIYLKSFGGNAMKYKHALVKAPSPEHLQNLKQQMTKNQKIYTDLLNKKSNKSNLINTNGNLREMFKSETNWTSNRGYKLYVGKKQDILSLFDDMKMPTKPLHFNLTLPENSKDSTFFQTLKQVALDELQMFYDEIKPTRLFNSSVFLSRLAYTLMAVSNKSFNNKYFYLDHLGLKNVFLIVKGGKKITSTRKTKIFKIIYPCNSELSNWNPTVFLSEGNTFDETPWMQLHQNVLQDLLAAPYKILANYIHLRDLHSADTSMEILAMPYLLLCHNRRKTEIMLHNMRYICVNPIGVFSQVGKMLEEFSGPTYSAFDHSIRFGLVHNYLKYYETVRKWSEHQSNDNLFFQTSKINHPYLNRFIVSMTDLTFVFYSTYLMSKGAYNQSIEQSNNLSKIMETHSTFKGSESDHMYNIIFDKDVDQLKNDDFGFSPQVAYNVGKFLSAELRRKHAANHMNIKWHNILQEPIDNMANNKGLRYKDKDFFGHKGYFVVYKELFEKNINSIYSILDMDEGKKQHQALKDINETFETAQKDNKLEQVIFHVVDKSQRGGGREIYVMDYVTKLYQYPIEKMFKYVCEFIDNEMISIPSARRAGMIHRKCFEYKNPKYITYYLTLDCRKWAPKSNTLKYKYMLLGMQDVLPDDFFMSTLEYFHQHEQKQIHTRQQILDQFLSNPDNLKYKRFFTSDEVKGSAFFTMPYSFVMGIFNMLSSLLHAGAQQYFKYIIEKESLELRQILDIDMFAHSDDSGGRISISEADLDENHSKCKSVLKKYEFTMKSLNHLMSSKKCNVSLTYFELLSILYMNSNLLPLLPKFLGNISVNFTGKGLSSDMKQVISKSIELQANGATGAQAYKVQIILSNMYRNFYRVQLDTQLPALGGVANSWPTLYLSYGSAVDEVRIIKYDYQFARKFMAFALNNLDYEMTDGTINLKYKNIIRMPKAYLKYQKQIKLPEFENNQWFFEQNKTRHAYLNTFWFRAKLASSDFALSLLNINEVRRLYDSLYMAKGENIIGKANVYNINTLITGILENDTIDTPIETILRTMYRSLFRLYEFTEDLEMPRFSSKTSLVTKPCTLTMNNFVDSPITDFNSLHLATQMTRPELMKYTFSNKRYGQELHVMMEYLNRLGVPNDIVSRKNFLDYMNKVKNDVKHFYADLPSNRRTLQANSGIFELIKESFHCNKKITNIRRDFVEQSKIEYEMESIVKKMILLYYFYIIYSHTKNDEIAAITIDPNIMGGKTYTVSTAIEAIHNHMPYPQYLQYLSLIETQTTKQINLANYNNWTIWTKKQSKIGDMWVGQGEFICKLDDDFIRFTVLNKNIIKVEHKRYHSLTISETARKYFYMILKEFDLTFALPIVPEMGKLYFGLNEQMSLGFHTGNNAILGVQSSIHNSSFDVTIYDRNYSHNYYNGRHFIEIGNVNYRLNTIDEIIFEKNKTSIFDIIDWDTISLASKNVFMNAYFSGEYGSLTGIEFDRNQLIDAFLSTDLYRMFYKNKDSNFNITQIIWDDITSNVHNSEEAFPTLFENLGIKELESIMPKSKKDHLLLYLYYDTNNEDLRTLRVKLGNMTSDSERLEFVSKLITLLQDEKGLITLPEVGDPQEFQKYTKNNLSHEVWLSTMELIANALYQGYLTLSESSRIELSKLGPYLFKTPDDIVYAIMRSNCDLKALYLNEFRAFTNISLFIHQLLTKIFNEKQAFADFAVKFRKTHMRSVPRHPYYEKEWQTLLAEMFKWFYCTSSRNYNLPSYVVRKKHMETIEHNFTEYNPHDICVTSVNPLSIRFFMRTNPIEKELLEKQITYKEIEDENLATLLFIDSNKNDRSNIINLIEENFDATMVKRKKAASKVVLCQSIYDCIDFCNSNYSNNNLAVASPFIHNMYPSKKVILSTNKGNNVVFYLYNFSETNYAETSRNEMRIIDEYKSYYNVIKEKKFSLIPEPELKESIKFDILTAPRLDNLITSASITSQDTYNDQFINFLSEHYNLTDEDQVCLSKIFSMNISAIGKFQRLKKYINDKIKIDDPFSNIDQLLQEMFNKTQKGKINLDIDEFKVLKLGLAKTDRNPSKTIERLTTYKKEFKQADTLLGFKYGDLLVENLTLTPSIKEYLVTNFKILSKQLKNIGDKNGQATCLVAANLITSIKEGRQSSEANSFDEDMRILINHLQKKLLDDEDDSDEIPEPVYQMPEWHYKTNKRK